jgi:hypothetical protein
MSIFALTFWTLIGLAALYLVFVKDPLHPLQGLAANKWTILGLIVFLGVFWWCYTGLAATPALLQDRSITHFRQRAQYTWMLYLPATHVAFSESDKNELLLELQEGDLKSFEPEAVRYTVTGTWLPVQWVPPKFWVMQAVITGKATFADPAKAPETREVIMNRVGDSEELQAWLLEHENGKVAGGGSGAIAVRDPKYFGPISDIPGRIK